MNDAIIWLPDLARWAATVAGLLVPGGRFYMAEFHPFSVVLGEEDLTVTDSYFDSGPVLHDEPGSFADPAARTIHQQSVTWNHGLGSVVSSLAQAGLRIGFLHEHPYTLRARWPFLERRADRTHHMPAGPAGAAAAVIAEGDAAGLAPVSEEALLSRSG